MKKMRTFLLVWLFCALTVAMFSLRPRDALDSAAGPAESQAHLQVPSPSSLTPKSDVVNKPGPKAPRSLAEQNPESQASLQVDRVSADEIKGLPSEQEEREARNARLATSWSGRSTSAENTAELIEMVRSFPEDAEFATPLRKHLDPYLRRAFRKKFDAGELYFECGGGVCFLSGVTDRSPLDDLRRNLHKESEEHDLGVVIMKSWKTESYGWVYFIIGEDAAI